MSKLALLDPTRTKERGNLGVDRLASRIPGPPRNARSDEKASDALWNLLLGILDKGTLTRRGRVLSCWGMASRAA